MIVEEIPTVFLMQRFFHERFCVCAYMCVHVCGRETVVRDPLHGVRLTNRALCKTPDSTHLNRMKVMP